MEAEIETRSAKKRRQNRIRQQRYRNRHTLTQEQRLQRDTVLNIIPSRPEIPLTTTTDLSTGLRSLGLDDVDDSDIPTII